MDMYSEKRKRGRYGAAEFADRLILCAVLAGIALFILYPIASVVATSFFKQGRFTLEYYVELASPKSVRLIKNSLWVAALSSVFTTAAAFFIALAAFAADGRKRQFIRKALLLTMISPPFVSALAYILLFGRRGLVTYQLLGLSVNPYGWHGIVILQVIGSVSFAALMLLNSFDNMDQRMILASRDLGATPGQTLLSVIFPLMRPGILSVLFMLFTMNLADFGTPIVIGGNYKVLASEAYTQAISTANLGRASAISVLMVPAAAVAFYFYYRAMKLNGENSATDRTAFDGAPVYSLTVWVAAVTWGVTGLFFLVMALKYGNIFLSAFSNTASGRLDFTLDYFGKLPRSQWSSFRHSLVYSAIAAFAASLLGILLSYYTHRRKIRGMRGAEFLASLPYIIPGTFYGLGYVAAFSHPPIYIRGTSAIIILNMAFRQISLTNKASNAAFAGLNRRLEDAARDLGASRTDVLFGVILPLLKPTFVTGFISVFTSCMTAVGAIIFLISPGKNVASAELFQSIENGRYGVASVQAVFIILVTVGINLIAMSLLNRSDRGGKCDVFADEKPEKAV